MPGPGEAVTLADEQALIAAMHAGAWADFTQTPGYDADAKPVVPARLLRDTLLGLDSRISGLPAGLRIRGARIEGDLDLADCTPASGGSFGVVALEACDFTGRIDITNADFSRFSIRQSRFCELWGEGVKVSGDFDFRDTAPLPSQAEPAAYIRLRAARSAAICGPGEPP